MKNLRALLVFVAMVCFISMNTFAQSETNMGKSVMWTQDMCFPCPCANGGEGEWLCGSVTFHVVINDNVEHWNIIGGKLEGDTTGEKYNFSRSSMYKPETGELVLNVRTKGKKGLVTFWQIIGEAEFDGEYHALNGDDVKFYCK